MDVTSLSHRTESSCDRLRRTIPRQPPVDRVVRVVTVPMALRTLIIRKIENSVAEKVRNSLGICSAPLARRIEDAGFAESIKITNGPFNGARLVVTPLFSQRRE